MACKYCHPTVTGIEPLGAEPLLSDGGSRVTIERQNDASVASLVMEADDHRAVRRIYFCPICGESLQPFGPAWSWELDR